MMQCYSVVACLFVHQDQLPRDIRVTSGTSVCPKNYAHGSSSPPIDFTHVRQGNFRDTKIASQTAYIVMMFAEVFYGVK